MGISRITRNFQITIPKDVRELTGLKEGDEMMLTVENDAIRIRRRQEVLNATAGLWKGMNETGLQYQRRMRKQWKNRNPGW